MKRLTLFTFTEEETTCGLLISMEMRFFPGPRHELLSDDRILSESEIREAKFDIRSDTLQEMFAELLQASKEKVNIVNQFQDEPMFAILDGHEVVPTDDVLYWAVSRSRKENRIAQEEVNGYWVSTVFLGVNHGTTNPGWFETMLFAPIPEEPSKPNRVVLSLRTDTYDKAMLAHFVHKQLAAEMKPPHERRQPD